MHCGSYGVLFVPGQPHVGWMHPQIFIPVWLRGKGIPNPNPMKFLIMVSTGTMTWPTGCFYQLWRYQIIPNVIKHIDLPSRWSHSWNVRYKYNCRHCCGVWMGILLLPRAFICLLLLSPLEFCIGAISVFLFYSAITACCSGLCYLWCLPIR